MRKPKTYRSISELPPVYVPVADLEKNFAVIAAEADRLYGPHVPPLTPRGRPRKGTTVEKTASHTVRIAESVWKAAQARAEALGISTNAAVQLAVRQWSDRGTP